MALDYRRGSVSFDPTAGQIQSEQGAVVFSSAVSRAEVSIAGYDLKYNNGDHHILREMVEAHVDNVQGATVFFHVDYLLRDDSGNIDDPFSGSVDVLVIADVDQPRMRPPRATVSAAAARD